MHHQFPTNPSHGMIFEVLPGLFFVYDAANNTWTRMEGTNSLLATSTDPGLMSAADFRKLNTILNPPPLSTIGSDQCTTRFSSGLVSLLPLDQYIKIAGEAPLLNRVGGRPVTAGSVPQQITENTHFVNFSLDKNALARELIRRGQLRFSGPPGIKGPRGPRGRDGVQLPTGMQGDRGDPGQGPPVTANVIPDHVPYSPETVPRAVTGFEIRETAAGATLVVKRCAIGTTPPPTTTPPPGGTTPPPPAQNRIYNLIRLQNGGCQCTEAGVFPPGSTRQGVYISRTSCEADLALCSSGGTPPNFRLWRLPSSGNVCVCVHRLELPATFDAALLGAFNTLDDCINASNRTCGQGGGGLPPTTTTVAPYIYAGPPLNKLLVDCQRGSPMVLAMEKHTATAQSIYTIDVRPILAAIREKYRSEALRIKKGMEDITAFWYTTMRAQFERQKTTLCCALIDCSNRGLRGSSQGFAFFGGGGGGGGGGGHQGFGPEFGGQHASFIPNRTRLDAGEISAGELTAGEVTAGELTAGYSELVVAAGDAALASCQVSLEVLAAYADNWRRGSCFGFVTRVAGQNYAVIKVPAGQLRGLNLDGCLSQFGGQTSPTIAWPTFDGKTLLPFPNAAGVTFKQDEALALAVLKNVEAAAISHVRGNQALVKPPILFPVF